MCELIGVTIAFFFSPGLYFSLDHFLWYVQPHKQQCCPLSCTGTWVSVSSRGREDEGGSVEAGLLSMEILIKPHVEKW